MERHQVKASFPLGDGGLTSELDFFSDHHYRKKTMKQTYSSQPEFPEPGLRSKASPSSGRCCRPKFVDIAAVDSHFTRILFFTGKGGVGKSRRACARETSSFYDGKRRLLMSATWS